VQSQPFNSLTQFVTCVTHCITDSTHCFPLCVHAAATMAFRNYFSVHAAAPHFMYTWLHSIPHGQHYYVNSRGSLRLAWHPLVINISACNYRCNYRFTCYHTASVAMLIQVVHSVLLGIHSLPISVHTTVDSLVTTRPASLC